MEEKKRKRKEGREIAQKILRIFIQKIFRIFILFSSLH